MPPDPPSISMLRMLIVVLCTVNSTSNFTLYKGPHLYFYAPGPLISLGAPAEHDQYLSEIGPSLQLAIRPC